MRYLLCGFFGGLVGVSLRGLRDIWRAGEVRWYDGTRPLGQPRVWHFRKGS